MSFGSNFLFEFLISCLLFPISYFLFPISYFLFPISCFLFPVSYFLFPISYFLFEFPTVFNLEISQSGSYVPHVILNWVILEMVRVKLWYTKKKYFGKLTSSKPLQRIRFQFFMFFTVWFLYWSEKSDYMNIRYCCRW